MQTFKELSVEHSTPQTWKVTVQDREGNKVSILATDTRAYVAVRKAIKNHFGDMFEFSWPNLNGLSGGSSRHSISSPINKDGWFTDLFVERADHE